MQWRLFSRLAHLAPPPKQKAKAHVTVARCMSRWFRTAHQEAQIYTLLYAKKTKKCNGVFSQDLLISRHCRNRMHEHASLFRIACPVAAVRRFEGRKSKHHYTPKFPKLQWRLFSRLAHLAPSPQQNARTRVHVARCTPRCRRPALSGTQI